MRPYTLIFSFLFIGLFSNPLLGHKTNEAFFKITQNATTVEIATEFPWTLREALLTYRPALKNATDKKAFHNAFRDYIKANLIVTDKMNRPFEFVLFEQLETIGHSHGNSYKLIFKGSGLHKIENTLMFNLFDNQVNYHRIKTDGTTTLFKTALGQTGFELSDKRVFSPGWVLLFVSLLVVFLYQERKSPVPLNQA